MPNEESLPLKEKFIKIYANLPLNVREEIIATLPQIGPLTWNSAYLEVIEDSELGKKILEELDELEII